MRIVGETCCKRNKDSLNEKDKLKHAEIKTNVYKKQKTKSVETYYNL